MSKYTKEQLRSVFQRPFNKDTWKTILIDIFRAKNVRVEPEKFTDPSQSETGWYMGNIETPDNYRIGLFFYRINSGSVAHKKVGLRNLVKSWVNPNWGEFDAAIVVFSDGTDWRLSFVCEIKDVATSPKRFTFVFGEKDNFYRTPIERFTTLQDEEPTFKNIHKAFSVEALSDDFFDQYRDHYADFVEFITGKRYVKEGTKWVERVIHKPNYQYSDTFGCDDKLVRDYIKKMFGRIVFLYFLQRKEWLDGNRNYMHDLFVNSDKKDDFLDGVLEPLFFEILNTDKPYRTAAAKALPGSDNIPYLNGGLFAADDIDELDCKFPESLFSKFFNFLDSYNFTIDENDTDDAEIGIDPEMLGRIFENLLEDNKDKGAFYTPKEIVDYMCRESIIAYLQNERFTDSGNETIRKFVETYDGASLSVEQRKYLKDKLKSVKICDPAIGSGAFPMGLVNLLSKLYSALRLSTDAAVIKRHIMEQNIYGVDIEKGAVDIARLRFWLAMIVEEKDPIPLPNLHFKIMQGNSLLESYQGVDLSDMTKVKPFIRNLFDSEDTERETLVVDLKKYYETSDHAERDRLFNEIIKNVRRQLLAKNITLPQGMDPSTNEDFFLWHTWFSDVFENGGFDIVIGNPPYFVYQECHVGEIATLRKELDYKIAFGGKLNAYKLFLANALKKLVKKNGVNCFIFQNSFLGDRQASQIRKFVLENTKILCIDSFPERDSKKKRVFESVKMSVCIALIKNTKCPESYVFPVNVWDDRYKSSGLLTQFSYNDLLNLDSQELSIPRLDYKYTPIVIKLLRHKEIQLKCIEGELNMTVHKKYFTNDSNNPLILKGASIQRYFYTLNMSQGEVEYLKGDAYQSKYGSSKKAHHHQYERIAMQGMTGANDKIRLVMSLVPKGIYLANSCNYILPTGNISLKSLLALLNSKTINWFFRCFSTNSNVNGYEVDNFPIPNIIPQKQIELDHLVDKISFHRSKGDISNALKYETQIDIIVYHLYNLTYGEVMIIDPETSITEEEYNQHI